MECQSPSDHSAGGPTVNVPTKDSISTLLLQTLAFKAATGKALTIFRAGFAFTMPTLSQTSLFPACVAGFVRIFNFAWNSENASLLYFCSRNTGKRVEQLGSHRLLHANLLVQCLFGFLLLFFSLTLLFAPSSSLFLSFPTSSKQI